MSIVNLARVSFRIFFTGQQRRIRKRRYTGSPASICRQIVERCYNKKHEFFQTSADTYPELWSRDFGRCVPALIHTGYEAEVTKSYHFALRAYQRAGRFELTILPDGGLYNFPFGTYAPDGFAFLLYGLCALGNHELVRNHFHFLSREAMRFFRLVVNPTDGSVKSTVHFSEAQDYLRRDASCYTTSICYIVQQALTRLGIPNPLENFNYPHLLLSKYYNANLDYFYDDENRRPYISGDANILPYWSGAVHPNSPTSFDAVLASVDNAHLTGPFPMRYRNGTEKLPSLRLDHLNPWQSSSVWTCLGIHLLETLYLYNRSRFHEERKQLELLVTQERCFPEVVDSRTRRLYSYPLYVAETSMLWAANFLNLLQNNPRVAHEHLRPFGEENRHDTKHQTTH
ncbi:MAG: hypothetical protein JXX29_05665 [Deltaproteobacteria bacterium]|nr:hypothetical protein [Deltaproteobacteria bacterium]MBN2671136.1 hypothetical protein [Deltaproteobacteria bacterium]